MIILFPTSEYSKAILNKKKHMKANYLLHLMKGFLVLLFLETFLIAYVKVLRSCFYWFQIYTLTWTNNWQYVFN